MRPPGAWLFVAILTVLLGCSDKSRPTSASPPSVAGSPSVAIDGGEGAVMAALWPAHWKKLGSGLAALAETLPPELRPSIAAMVAVIEEDVATPWAAVRAAAFRGLGVKLPESPPGLDERRPIVVAAFTPIESSEAIIASLTETLVAVRSGARPGASLAPFGMRHRVSLPARDPKALFALLTSALAAGDRLQKIADPAGSGTVATFGDEELLVRLVADATTVSVAIASGVGLSGLPAATRDRVLGGRTAWTPDQTGFLADPNASIARLHLRLDRFGEVGSALGMTMVARAIASFGGDEAAAILMQGYSEVLTAELVMDPAGAAVSDVIADLPATATFAPALYLVTTPRGREALRAEPKLARGSPVALLEIDPHAAARTAPAPPIFEGVTSLGDAAELMHECGALCVSYLGLGNGLRLFALGDAGALDLRDAAKELPQLRLPRLTLAGAVLVVEPAGNAETAAVTARARAIAPPQRSEPSAEARCHAQAQLALRRALRVAAGDPTRASEVLDHFEAEQRANLDCAARDATLRPRVEHVRRALVSFRELARAR